MTIRHLYPAVEPSLNLDFANSKKLDPRITFTRASTGTYVGADGLIKTAAANQARFDHDGDGNSLGLLIEESRTNLHIGSTSNALNQGVVGLTQGSVSTSDPTGSISTVETWTVTASTGTHAGYRFYNNTYVDFTWSIFVKSNGITRIQVSASQRDNASYIEVDLTDGSIINQTDSYATVTPLSGGWVRISSTKLADRAHGPGFWLLDNNGNRSFTGNGTDGIYVWGIQLEQQNGATFPTAYIPTTSSTVTRSADVASMTGTNFSSWFNASTGTLALEHRLPVVYSNNATLLTITGDPVNTLYMRGNNSEHFTVLSAGTVAAQATGGGNYVVGFNKCAGAYALNNFRVSTNGNISSLDSSGLSLDAATTPMTQMGLGSALANPGSSPTSVTIARLTYYPVRLPDATLQALTL